jgi:hypothetical protein
VKTCGLIIHSVGWPSFLQEIRRPTKSSLGNKVATSRNKNLSAISMVDQWVFF